MSAEPPSKPQAPSTAGTQAAESLLPRIGVEALARTAAIVTVTLYVVGLLVVNMYLGRSNLSDFSLLRTRFTLTGIVTIMPVIIMCTFILSAWSNYMQWKQKIVPGWLFWSYTLLAIMLSYFINAWFASIIFDRRRTEVFSVDYIILWIMSFSSGWFLIDTCERVLIYNRRVYTSNIDRICIYSHGNKNYENKIIMFKM